jgi:hypothetical protein
VHEFFGDGLEPLRLGLRMMSEVMLDSDPGLAKWIGQEVE